MKTSNVSAVDAEAARQAIKDHTQLLMTVDRGREFQKCSGRDGVWRMH